MIYMKSVIMNFRPPGQKTGITCKSGLDRKPGGHVKQKNSPEATQNQPPALLCRQCLGFITRPGERIVVNGTHHHTFANPHGIVFEIGCFQQAPGCAAAGPPTDEFSWFAGYNWRIAICANCLTHMGWLFTAAGGGSRFYGLILDNLVESAAGFEKK